MAKTKFDGLVQECPKLVKFTVFTEEGSSFQVKAVDAQAAADLVEANSGAPLLVFKGKVENLLV